MRPIISSIFLCTVLLSSSVWSESLTVWINSRATEQVLANIDKTNSTTKQAGTSSNNQNPTSLVDHSSAADLFSLALNQAGFSTGNKAASSTSASATIFAIYAALHGTDPLDPEFYNKNAALRRVSLNLGFDEKGEGADKKTTRLYGLKWTILDHRQPTQKDKDDLLSSINAAGFARGRIDLKVQAYLFKSSTMQDTIRQEYRQFLEREQNKSDQGCLKSETSASLDVEVNRILDLDFGNNGEMIQPSLCEQIYFVEWVNKHAGTSFDPTTLSEKDRAALDRIIEVELAPLVALENKTKEIIQRAQTGPQLALVATYKDLPVTGRAYVGEATFDYGLSERFTLTLNGNYESTNGSSTEAMQASQMGGSGDSWKLAGQLRYQLTKETLTRKAMYLDLTGDRKRSDGDSTYKIQAKTSFPLAGGVTIPVSVTYASNAKLIQENDVRGQIGFSIDLSKLAEGFRH